MATETEQSRASSTILSEDLTQKIVASDQEGLPEYKAPNINDLTKVGDGTSGFRFGGIMLTRYTDKKNPDRIITSTSELESHNAQVSEGNDVIEQK